MKTARWVLLLGLFAVVFVTRGPRAVVAQGAGPIQYPTWEVDPSWPKLPNNWVEGVTPSVATDKRDHVWIFHRPLTVPEAQRAHAAPPVMEFDATGKFVRGWGGPAAGYDWPASEHGITVDDKESIWLTGFVVGDDMLLKFTNDGKFIKQFGKKGASTGNQDTVNVNRPADLFVNQKTNELYVADGYGNRRVIVFDADTGAFKRMWGAFGNPPDTNPAGGSAAANAAAGARQGRAGAAGAAGAAPAGGRAPAAPRGAQAPNLDTEGPGPMLFGNPVHSVKVSTDGFVYVADRSNRRIQVFTTDGKFVSQTFINRSGPAAASACGLVFSPDREQKYLYVADFGNSHIVVLDRKSMQILYQFGVRGNAPGEFQGIHLMAVDSKNNLYTAEVQLPRAQKFVFKGFSNTLPKNALTPDQIRTPPPSAQ